MVTDIQTLNIDLSTGVGLNSSSEITGIDLTSVILSGSGKFDLNSNTITGSDTTRVVLDASSLTESVTILPETQPQIVWLKLQLDPQPTQ